MNEFALRNELSKAESTVRRLRKALRKSKGLPAKRKGMGCRIGDRDDALKAARGYVEPGSFVRRDGSEKLVGRDWRKRKQEIWERGGGKCEKILEFYVGGFAASRCQNEMHDPHHKIKRSKGRDDRAENLIGLCRLHHDLEDARKVRSGKVGGAKGDGFLER